MFFRYSLQDCLAEHLVPSLAKLISFIDVRSNLSQLANSSPTIKDLWVKIFAECHNIGLLKKPANIDQHSSVEVEYSFSLI